MPNQPWKHLLHSELATNHAKIRFKINNPTIPVTFIAHLNQSPDTLASRATKMPLQDWSSCIKHPILSYNISPIKITQIFNDAISKAASSKEHELLLIEILKRDHLARMIGYEEFLPLWEFSIDFVKYIRDFPSFFLRCGVSKISSIYSYKSDSVKLFMLSAIERFCAEEKLNEQQTLWILEFLETALADNNFIPREFTALLPYIRMLYDTRPHFARSMLTKAHLKAILRIPHVLHETSDEPNALYHLGSYYHYVQRNLKMASQTYYNAWKQDQCIQSLLRTCELQMQTGLERGWSWLNKAIELIDPDNFQLHVTIQRFLSYAQDKDFAYARTKRAEIEQKLNDKRVIMIELEHNMSQFTLREDENGEAQPSQVIKRSLRI